MTPQSSDISTCPDYWGVIATPARWSNKISAGRPWCVDNGVFTGKFSPDGFWSFLTKMQPYKKTCVFVVAPDVVGNAIATMTAYRYWGPRIKAQGWPVAFVAQDGQELYPLPPEYDALFIGGSTEWKMSSAALDCIKWAQAKGKWVHVGRVNSQKRIAHFQLAGVDSVDGTSICFAPDREKKRLSKQLAMQPLFTL